MTLGKKEKKKKPVFTQPCGRCLLFVLGASTVGSAPAQLPERWLHCSQAAGGKAEALGTNLPKSLALRPPDFPMVGRVGTGWGAVACSQYLPTV